eukprot:evm.model.scf_334.3 EVM.evm.TU.scf_334.3   scf_334:28346-36947(-)
MFAATHQYYYRHSEFLFSSVYHQGLPPPVCVMDEWQYTKLVGRMDEMDGRGADFSGAILYTQEDEPSPSPVITDVDILTYNDKDEPKAINIPVSTSLFNPKETDEIVAPVKLFTFQDSCYLHTGSETASANYSECVSCWDSNAVVPLTGHRGPDDLMGKVALFDVREGYPICYMWVYNFVMLAQDHGAVGAILGLGSDTQLVIGGPYLLYADVHIPMFSAGATATGALLHAMQEVHSADQQVKVRLPALSNRAGRPFYAGGVFANSRPDYVDIAFWDRSADDGEDDRHVSFECRAGVGRFNKTFDGVAPPRWNGDRPPNGTILTRVQPVSLCRNASTCAQCLHLSKQVTIEDSVNGSSNSTGDLVLWMAFDDFPCYTEYNLFLEAAETLDPVALVLGLNYSDFNFHEAGFEPRNLSRAFPIFSVNLQCGARLAADMDAMYVSLPILKEGYAHTAGSYLSTYLPETLVKRQLPQGGAVTRCDVS